MEKLPEIVTRRRGERGEEGTTKNFDYEIHGNHEKERNGQGKFNRRERGERRGKGTKKH
jgi:hypothetical protein